jgi:hypothetical protein
MLLATQKRQLVWAFLKTELTARIEITIFMKVIRITHFTNNVHANAGIFGRFSIIIIVYILRVSDSVVATKTSV